jgi:cystathionine gamma-lyase
MTVDQALSVSNGQAAAEQYGADVAPPASSNGHANGGGNGNGHAESEHEHVRASDGFVTRSIHVGSRPDPSTGAVVPGLHVATTYKQYGVGKHHVS